MFPPVDQLPIADIRAVGGVLAVIVLLYWTYERLAGQGADPVLRSSSSSDTGSASILLSGSMAVAAVAGLAGAMLLSPVAGGPVVDATEPVLLGLGGIVLAHWIVEKEETE
jgi:hypothetical protein